MTIFKNFIAVTGCILCACFSAKAQNIDAALKAYSDKYTPERAYIHYDKAAYSAGETIWFKAYLMSEVSPGRGK